MKKKQLQSELEAEWSNADGDLPFNTRASPSKIAIIATKLFADGAVDDRLRNRFAQWLRFASWSHDDTSAVAQATERLHVLFNSADEKRLVFFTSNTC